LGKSAFVAAAGIIIPGIVAAATEEDALDETPMALTRRISSLSSREWQDYFPSLRNDAVLSIIDDRVLHYWGEDGFYRIYPTSVPLSDEMTRRGRTEVVFKRPAPEWRPTPSMVERNPDLPRYVGPGPENPLGIRALNLSWQYYLIHGTNDIRKIGRQSSSGCIGLFNEHIVEVYDRAKVGTQVLVL
jgi:lipoprotein-anchoring transpeptidase ErfK/SrfK